MVIGTAIIIVGILAVAIYAVIELQRFKHKLFAIFLIGLLIFGYISMTLVFKGKEIDFKSVDGLKLASKTYLSWIGSAFGNMKSITTNAVKMDWSSTNKTFEEK